MKIEQSEGRGDRGACQMVFPNICMHLSPHPLQEEEQTWCLSFGSFCFCALCVYHGGPGIVAESVCKSWTMEFNSLRLWLDTLVSRLTCACSAPWWEGIVLQPDDPETLYLHNHFLILLPPAGFTPPGGCPPTLVDQEPKRNAFALHSRADGLGHFEKCS